MLTRKRKKKTDSGDSLLELGEDSDSSSPIVAGDTIILDAPAFVLETAELAFVDASKITAKNKQNNKTQEIKKAKHSFEAAEDEANS